MRTCLKSVLLLMAAAACGGERAKPSVPQTRAQTDSLQGLSGAQRDSLHHLSEGDEFIKLSVLRALNNVATGRAFLDDIERFGMVHDPAEADGLPIGLSAASPPDVGRVTDKMVGFTCAACHTSALAYKGTVMIVEGAPALIDAERFEKELLASLDALRAPSELAGFFARLRDQPSNSVVATQLTLADVPKLLDAFRRRLDSFRALKALLEHTEQTTPGYGRIDAFGTGRDLLFPDSKLPLTAPVRYPKVWDAYRRKWLHWDANTNSVMERNIGQAIAAGAVFDPVTKRSTLLPENLHALESLVQRIQPPRWPVAVLGPLDTMLARQGRQIYAQECERCHALRAAVDRDTLLPYRVVGTDMQRAVSAAIPLRNGGLYPVVAGRLLREIKDSAFRQNRISPERQRAMEGDRATSEWRVTQSYVARPLTGVWATAPYLHNGSVPTLRDLLLPVVSRPTSFLMGSHEYDPVNVGLATDSSRTAPPFRFDTRRTGNSNAGHEYSITLTEPQRRQLLEYLKTL